MAAELFHQRLEEAIAVKSSMSALIPQLEPAARQVRRCFESGGKVLVCGNGGSAADAQHVVGEFVGRYYQNRPPLPAVALPADTAVMTALANDYGYDHVFARQVKGLGRPGDVLIGLSTSGNSSNVVLAFESAMQLGLFTISFTGAAGGRLAALADLPICIPTSRTPLIQEGYLFALHVICEYVEQTMFPSTVVRE